jgi:hypothetical protein
METHLTSEKLEQEIYVGIPSEIRQFMIDSYECISAMRLVSHAHEDEQKKFRTAFSEVYNYFHAIDRMMDGMNKRIQMLELRIAKDNESGHA